ncbi:hypothetical protein IHE44_0010435 [Lamprotornis superbus]|uniref:FIP-RBD domain-containing protein n=1 Tax=Lamprotornis superbus TaxID=245042 RepID=A0A835NIJ6_9PASS|nr:hypothetical protein IHE44_0010435 [Lamprotornis superbus]
MLWYKLHSKPGKKEKERGEIEVDIQFMRSNMTASMFDLSMKDKPRSPFGKLKDKLKGKRSSGLSDTASEIVPSTSHSPADSEDEAAEKEKKKSKFKALFSKPGLQKTSLSQSMSVLPTQQPLTQRVRLRPSDFQPQWDEEESETSPVSERSFENALEEKPAPSPLFKSRKPAFLDSRQLTQGTTNHTKKDGLSLFSGLKSKSDPVSKSSLCINGSHIYMEETTTKDKTPTSSPSPHNLRRKQLFASEENLSSRSTKSPEEMERTSPGQAFSGSTSLETFKSMTLPSYKLLSSEEHLDTSIPPSVEAVRETKKPEHKKSALLSLVTGKKETVKTSDVEIIPDRTLQNEENAIAEEKSEEEAKCPEGPADLGRGSPSGDVLHVEEAVTNKQLLSPCEEEHKPEKAAAAKTKAVKPSLRACTVSPREGDPGRAGSKVLVPPKPAPRVAALLRKSPVTSQAELRADVPASGDAVKSTQGLPFPGDEASAARGCLPPGASLEPVTPAVTPRGNSSGRPSGKEGGDDFSVSVTDLRSAIAVPGGRGSVLAALPVIPEGGSDDELLGDCQESSGLTAGDKGVLGNGEQPRGLHGEQRELSVISAIPAAQGGGGAVAGAWKPGGLAVLPAAVGVPRVCVQGADSGSGVMSHSRECASHFEKQELERSAGVEECAESDFSEPSAFSSSLSSPCQPYSSSHSLLSDTPSRRAESPKKPAAEGFADKAGNSGKKKLLQARVSPSETFPNQTPRGAETVSPQHRLHPVKPMNAMTNKPQSKSLNVISTMNEKLLEMSVKKYDPSDPAYAYAQLTHDELIQLVLKQKDTITRKDLQVRELEDYIDNLLVRVMEETPNILRVSMSGNRKAGKMI